MKREIKLSLNFSSENRTNGSHAVEGILGIERVIGSRPDNLDSILEVVFVKHSDKGSAPTACPENLLIALNAKKIEVEIAAATLALEHAKMIDIVRQVEELGYEVKENREGLFLHKIEE